MKNWLLCCAIIALLILSSCTEKETEGVSTSIPSTSQIENVPSTESAAQDAYPAPDDTNSLAGTESQTPGYPVADPVNNLPSEVIPVEAPVSSETGVVTGFLKRDDGSGAEPVSGEILYLGHIIYLDNGQPALGALNKQAAPVTQTTQLGQFIFKDVPPGEYTLIMDRVISTFILNSPATGGDMIIEVRGGEIKDLGELIYFDLPLPSE